MDVSTVAETTATVAAQRATTRGFNSLSSEDFFALLITELQSQNPLDPKDNQQLLAQMSSIREMEQNATLTKTLTSLAQEQRFGATTSMIGQYVAGAVTDQAGLPTEIQGLVIGVRFEGEGRAILELHNGLSLPANKVEQVTLVENLPPELQAQLQEELGASADTPPAGPGGEDTGDAAASARVIRGDASGRASTIGDPVRDFARGVDVVGDLLDSLFSPGVAVGIGS